jgi:solute carrier family 35 protein F5
MFVVLVPVFELMEWRRRPVRMTINKTDANADNEDDDAAADGERSALLVNSSSTRDDGRGGATPLTEGGNNQTTVGPITSRVKTLRAAAIVAPLWFLAQWSFNVSLAMTSITSNTIISSTAALWTLGLAVPFAGEQFTWLKLVGVLCCVGGTAVVSVGDASTNTHPNRTNSSANRWHPNGSTQQHRQYYQHHNPNADDHAAVYGNMVCLGSAVVYALYTTALRRWGSSAECSMLLLFGYIGLLSLLVLGPMLLLLGKLGLVSLKLSLEHFWWIVGKGLFDNVLSDYMWGVARVEFLLASAASILLLLEACLEEHACCLIVAAHVQLQTCLSRTPQIGCCYFLLLYLDDVTHQHRP